MLLIAVIRVVVVDDSIVMGGNK